MLNGALFQCGKAGLLLVIGTTSCRIAQLPGLEHFLILVQEWTVRRSGKALHGFAGGRGSSPNVVNGSNKWFQQKQTDAWLEKYWRKTMPFVPRWFAMRRLFIPCLDQRMNQGCWSVVINSPNMPEPGTQCFESSLTCNLQQPLDRTNPNWRMVEIEKPTIFKCICS